jgi:type II secretory pathway pseudopilin PulG
MNEVARDYKRKNGFTLLEIMIGAGLLAGLSLVVMNLTTQTTKSSAKYQFDTEVNLITNEINGMLADSAKCRTVLTNAVPPAVPTANITSPTSIAGKYLTAAGGAPAAGYGNGGVKIVSYSYSALPAPSNDGFLKITFENKTILKGSAGGNNTLVKNINLYVEQTAAGIITSCRSLSTASKEIWTKGVGDVAFYDGTVGIGTATPAYLSPVPSSGVSGIGYKLHVSQGPLLVSQDNGWGWGLLTVASHSETWDKHAVFMGLKARGTEAAPTYPLKGDMLAGFYGRDALDGLLNPAGYGGSEMVILATENMSHSNKGTKIVFSTTKNGATPPVPRPVLTLDQDGMLKMGDQNFANALSATWSTPAGTIISAFPNGNAVAIGQDGAGNGVGLGITRGVTATGAGSAAGVLSYNIVNNSFGLGSGSGIPLDLSTPTSHIHLSGSSNDIAINGKVAAVGDFSIAGNFSVTGTISSTGTITSASDRRLKKDITPLNDSLEKILNLRGVEFSWLDKKAGEGRQIGFIAQEVEKIFPELVSKNVKGIKSVAYQNLVAPLVEAIRDQQSEIEILKTELSETRTALCDINPKYKFCEVK